MIELPHPPQDIKENFFYYAEQCLRGGYHIEQKDVQTMLTFFDDFKQGKSILIYGNVGTGKSILFELLKRVIPQQSEDNFRIKNILNVIVDYNTRGHISFKQDEKSHTLYDDLGTEEKGIFYGDRIEVFEKLGQFRYDLWKNRNIRTYITTNLNQKEIKQRYGLRFWDRIKEQYTQLILDGTSKRTLKNFIQFYPVKHNTSESKEYDLWKQNYEKHKAERQQIKVDTKAEGLGSQLKKLYGT